MSGHAPIVPSPRFTGARLRRTCYIFPWDAATPATQSISGLVAEYIVAIDVTRVRFPADALASRTQVRMREIQVSTSVCDHPTPTHQQPPLLQSARALRGTVRVVSQKGAWCGGITSASHAEGPGFKSHCVHLEHHAPAFCRGGNRGRHRALLRIPGKGGWHGAPPLCGGYIQE